MPSLGSLIVSIGANIDGFTRAMGSVSQQLKEFERDAKKQFGAFDKIGDRLTTLGTGLSVGLTLPILGVGAAATSMAADFDLGIRKVGSLVGGFTDKEMKGLETQTLAVARSLGIDAVGATDALYEAVSAGIPKDNAISFLEVAAPAAIAGVTNTKVAVDALTSAINAYGLETSAAKPLADQMFQAVNLGKFTFEQLATSISIATPLAAQMGVSFAEILAPAATLTAQGFSVSEAMTSIRSAMVAIVTPNKQMNALLQEAGFQSGEAMLKTLGFQGSVEALRAASNGNNEALANAYGRVEALGAALGLTGEKAGKARADLDSVKHASDGVGAATAAFNAINQSATRQWESAVAQIKAAGIELGINLLPTLAKLLKAGQPLIQWLTDAVSWFGSLDKSTQTFILGITAAAAAIGPLLIGFGSLLSSITTVATTIGPMWALGTTAMASFQGALGNVITAVGSNLTGALTAGETMILRMGQAAAIGAAAFVGWQIGSWAYEQIPGVKALGDSIADVILQLPLMETALLKVSGASGAQKKATEDLDLATKKLEASLKAKGITVDSAGLSTAEYSKKLMDAARESGALGNSHDTQRAKIEAAKDEIKKTEARAKLYAQAQKELGTRVKTTSGEHKKAKDETKKYADGIPAEIVKDYEGKLRALELQIAKTKIETANAERAGLTWDQQLDANIASAAALVEQLNKLSTTEMPNTKLVIDQLGDATKGYDSALKALGITSASEYKRIAEEAQAALDAVMGSGVATDFEKQTAIYKATEAQVAYAKAAGIEITDEQKRILGQMKTDVEQKTPQIETAWGTFAGNVNSTFKGAFDDLGRSLFDGDLSFGEKFKKLTGALKDAFLDAFIKPVTDSIANFISGAIADLLGGKGFGGLLDGIKGIGSAIGSVFGGGGSAAAGAATTVGGAASTGAGGAASAAASGALGWVTGIASVGSLISGIIGNFQSARQETTLNAIEESTRYVKIWTGEQSQSMLWCLQTMTERSGYIVAALDGIGRFASDQLAWLERIGAAVEYANTQALTTPAVNVTIQGNVIGNSAFVDQIANAVASKLRLQGGAV